MTARVCKLVIRKALRDGDDIKSVWGDLFKKKDADLWEHVKQRLQVKFGEESLASQSLLKQINCSAVEARVREMLGGAEFDASKTKSFFFVSFYDGFCAFHAASPNWSASASAYLRALESVPSDGVVLNNLSIVLKNLKQFALAERCLFHANRLSAGNPVTLYNYGALKYAERRYSEALKLFCEAESAAGKQESESLNYSIAQCLIHLGRHVDAEKKLLSMSHSDEQKHAEMMMLLRGSDKSKQTMTKSSHEKTFVDSMLDEESCDERDASGSWSGSE